MVCSRKSCQQKSKVCIKKDVCLLPCDFLRLAYRCPLNYPAEDTENKTSQCHKRSKPGQEFGLQWFWQQERRWTTSCDGADTTPETETLHPEAETFNPCLRNEAVVEPVNMETADQIDVTFTPASERREGQNKPVEPETRSTQEDRLWELSTDS